MSFDLKRGAAWQLLQTVASTGGELLILLVLAAALGRTQFGEVAVALSGTKIVFMAFEGRLHEFLTPKLVHYLGRSSRGVWMWTRLSRRIELTLNLAALCVCLLSAMVLPPFIDAAATLPIAAAAAYNGANTLLKFTSLAMLRSLSQVREAALLAAAGTLLKIAVLAVALHRGADSGTVLLGMGCVGAMVAVGQAVRAGRLLRRVQSEPPRTAPSRLRREHLHHHAKLFFSNYANGLVEIVHREADVQLMAWIAGVGEAGRYRVAKTIAMVMLEALSPVLFMLLPDLSRRIARESADAVRAFTRKLSWMMGGIGVFAGLCVAAAAAIYFTFFLKSDQRAWAPCFLLIGVFASLAPMMWAQVYIVASGRPHVYLRASVVGAIGASAAATTLIPLWGAIGAAASHAIGLTIVTTLAYREARR